MGDFREPHHLPKQREGPGDPDELPRQRHGITPQMHGRYPDYDVLDDMRHWDEVTRKVVLERITDPPPIRFFEAKELEALTAFCDVVMHQTRDPRIPIIRFVDAKLYEGRLDGFQHVDLPDDRDTWRLVARGLDASARASGAPSFAEADDRLQREIVGAFAKAELRGEVWDDLNVEHAWGVVMRSVLGAFYSHPWAWNEIGFGGPAYPRGYMRLGMGLADPHEADEAFDVDPVKDVQERGLT